MWKVRSRIDRAWRPPQPGNVGRDYRSRMTCLDDSTVLRFITGRLDAVHHARVEEELGRCRRCAGLIAELARDGRTLASEQPARIVDEPADDAGQSPRYLLGEVIAHGGMGTILAAFDRKLGRPVALKRLDSEDLVLDVRFAREIRVTASLQHPGIVPIYDSGFLPDGRPFYGMRHVAGASLDTEIA